MNTAWMSGALLATSITGWLHQLTATSPPTDPGPMVTISPNTPKPLAGLGVRDGKAMIATLRHRLLCIPGRLIHHAGALILRLPPSHHLLTPVLTRLRELPHTS